MSPCQPSQPLGERVPTATINFDGGTLKPKAASATYMGGLTNAFIKAGGATFDTTGFDITVTQDLLTDVVSTGGGLTKAGTNTLTLSGANTYTGSTIVNGGALSITHNNALGSTVGSTTINGGNGTGAQSLTLTNATSDLVVAEALNILGNLAGRAQLVNNGAFNHEFTGAIDVSSDTNLAQFSSGSTGSITVSGDITGTMSGGARAVPARHFNQRPQPGDWQREPDRRQPGEDRRRHLARGCCGRDLQLGEHDPCERQTEHGRGQHSAVNRRIDNG